MIFHKKNTLLLNWPSKQLLMRHLVSWLLAAFLSLLTPGVAADCVVRSFSDSEQNVLDIYMAFTAVPPTLAAWPSGRVNWTPPVATSMSSWMPLPIPRSTTIALAT